MEANPLLWLPFSFSRKPEWRLLRAEFLLATGRRRDRRIDDAWVDLARDAIRGRGGEGRRLLRSGPPEPSGRATPPCGASWRPGC